LHVCVAVSQVSPSGQSGSPTQATQVLVASSHAGVLPVHAVWFFVVHFTQPPALAHA
jgi:hypothetical protein